MTDMSKVWAAACPLLLVLAACPSANSHLIGGSGGDAAADGGSIELDAGKMDRDSGSPPRDAAGQPDASDDNDGGGLDAIGDDATAGDATDTDAGSGDTGPPPDSGPGTLLLLAGGGSSIFTGELRTTAWSTSILTDATNDAPSLAFYGPASALGVIRSTANSGELHYTAWTPGSFSAFTPIAQGVTTRAAPAFAGTRTHADLAFQGDDMMYYFSSWSTSWNIDAEAIAVPGSHSFGPMPPSITTLGEADVVAFAGGDGNLYDQSRTNGSWNTAQGHNLTGMLTFTPQIAALASGPELLIVFVESSDSKVLFTTRSSGVWSTPAPIDPNAFASQHVALAALSGSGAVVAFRGNDANIYWSRYAPASGWSAVAPVASPNVMTPAAPAVASGLGVDAELAFISAADGAVYHARLTGQSWSAPTRIGGTGLTNVALARSP
jgi:hypothetical protein